MRLAEVVNGIVVNVAEVDPGQPVPAWASGWPDMGDTGGPGWLWDGASFAPPAPDPADMDRVRADAIANVESAIGLRRLEFITDLPGQAMIYQGKEAEALAWIAAGSPADLTAWPFLRSEAGITAPDASALATLWMTMAAAWRQIGAALEGQRMSAKAAIAAAVDQTAVSQALAAAMAAIATIGQTPAP